MFRYRLTVRPFEGTLCAMPDVQLTPSQTKVYARAADEHSSSTDTLNFLGIHRKYTPKVCKPLFVFRTQIESTHHTTHTCRVCGEKLSSDTPRQHT